MKKINYKNCFNYAKNITINVIKNMSKHNISEYTAQCAYYTILSFIPFFILVITLIQYTGISKEVLINAIKTIIPETMHSGINEMAFEIYSKSIGTISISAIFALLSARKGFYALSKGIGNIYDKDKNFKYEYIYVQIKSILLTIFLIITIIAMLLISVFGGVIVDYLKQKLSIPADVINIYKLSKIGIYFILFLVLLMIYKFVPTTKVKLIKQIPGAIFATFGWYVISFIFSIYLDTFKGFSVMYGSLTTVILSMMWVYFCMYIILVGAEINNINLQKNIEK